MKTITVSVNEQSLNVPEGAPLQSLLDAICPGADVLIVNGAPAVPGTLLGEGDRVVLLRKGETPREEDLQFLMMARHTPGVHQKMRKAVVGIAGLGGLGSTVAAHLARMGVGKLILADFDVVEPSNLNRQQYFIEHLGRPKATATAELLKKINPYLIAIPYCLKLTRENIPSIFNGTDIVIECFDEVAQKTMLIEVVAESLPTTFLIGASGLAGYGDSNSIKTHRLSDQIYIVGDLMSAAVPGRGLMAPRVGIAASHQANLAVSLLMAPNNPAL